MRIKIGPYKIGNFPKTKEPTLKKEYRNRIYFAVIEDTDNFWHEPDYYVVPVFLGVVSGLNCGDCITIREVLYHLGENYGIKYEDYLKPKHFKPYYEIDDKLFRYHSYRIISNQDAWAAIKAEIYDNVDEAIERVKNLENLPLLYEKRDKLSTLRKQLKSINDTIESYQKRKEKNPEKFPRTSELTLENKIITREKKLVWIEKAKKELKEVENEFKYKQPFYE